MRIPRRGFAALVLTAGSLVAAAPLAAQDISIGGRVDPAVTDSFLVLVPYRPQDEIRRELERARETRQAAEAERARSQELERRADAAIGVQKREIDLIKSREDFAKREKRDADRAMEQRRRKQAELTKQMLEKRRELRKSEAEAAEAQRRAAEARVQALELELELAERRDTYTRSVPSDTMAYQRQAPRDSAAIRQLTQQITELERRTLRARIDAANRERDYAERAKRLAERRLSLHEAQQKLAAEQ